jgi:hypothetical protein
VIDGQTYTSDVIILPDGVRGNWWREEGHDLRPGDLTAVLEASPEVLVVGQGAHGMMKVPERTRRQLREAGIEPVCAPTGEAVDTYNRHIQQDRRTAAALHLTC